MEKETCLYAENGAIAVYVGEKKVGQAKTRAKLAKLFKEHNVWKGDECSFDQSMENPEKHGWKDRRAVRWFVEDALAIYSTL